MILMNMIMLMMVVIELETVIIIIMMKIQMIKMTTVTADTWIWQQLCFISMSTGQFTHWEGKSITLYQRTVTLHWPPQIHFPNTYSQDGNRIQ